MINYKGFYFIKTYDLEDYFSKMYDDLVSQFDERVQKTGYFEDQAFIVLIGDDEEKVYHNDGYEEYSFLNVKLLFPPQARIERCTICWKNNEEGIPEFYWTTNFPEKELHEYTEKYK